MISIKDFKNSNPYKTTVNNKSIFIWLDILGFADALENEEKYEELYNLLRKFQLLFNNDDDYISNIISDGIILQKKNKKSKDLKKILNKIGEKQFQFILENKEFIRGGIAVGTKFEKFKSNGLKNNNNLYISNGLARAVNIEGKKLDWAIIGTNKENVIELNEIYSTNNDEEYFGLIQGFNEKGKKIFFIDFIEDNEKYYHLLNKNVKNYKNKPNIQTKYIWLLRYYHHKYGNSNLDKILEGIVL